MLPLLKLLKKNKNIDLKIIVTDQHTKKIFGNTYKSIAKDFGINNLIKINSTQKTDTLISRSNSFSNILKKLPLIFKKKKPNLLLLYGDRGESLISAIVANNFEIPICHFQGGDLSGNVDENFRHAITKLSNFHFASNFQSKKRILQLGERHKTCFNFGDTHIDSLKKVNLDKKNFKKIKSKYKLPNNYVTYLLHPEQKSSIENFKNSNIVLNVLKSFKKNIIAIYPCTDFGYMGIINSLKNFKKKYKSIKIFKNIIYSDFVNILKNSDFLIGNSSSGIIESAYLNLPVINLGYRQKNRLKSSNVFNSRFNSSHMKRIIKMLSRKKIKKPELLYGTGNSYKKTYIQILKILKSKIATYKNFNEI